MVTPRTLQTALTIPLIAALVTACSDDVKREKAPEKVSDTASDAVSDTAPDTVSDIGPAVDASDDGTPDDVSVVDVGADVTSATDGTLEADSPAPVDAGPTSCGADGDCPAGQRCVGATCHPELSVWPNSASSANSDPWLPAHHSTIRQLRPRVLALNFVNAKDNAQMSSHLAKLTAAMAEMSRPYGYKDAAAAPMCKPEVAYAVDLRDKPPPAGWKWGNSTHYPREQPKDGFWSFDYEQLFSAEFAAKMGIVDPDDGKTVLDLCALINRGLVHEVWVYGDADVPGDVSAAELLERKPRYDANRVRIAPTSMDGCAGNGCFDAEDTFPPACTRTVRIAWVNHSRGPGCFLESLSHGFESTGTGTPALIPYLRAHFPAFANFDLDTKHKLPFSSWYACDYDKPCLAYPTSTSVTWDLGKGAQTFDTYDPVCGNAHFAPNGTRHYDLSGTATVLTSCAGFRQGAGPGGADVQAPFTTAAFAPYSAAGQDCMGPFLVWWWQNMPGFASEARHTDGTPMLSWLPFVYY